jgi:hypothetical protein
VSNVAGAGNALRCETQPADACNAPESQNMEENDLQISQFSS